MRDKMLFLENEVDRQYQKNKCNQVVGFQCFVLEENSSEYNKYHKGDDLLDHLKLHK